MIRILAQISPDDVPAPLQPDEPFVASFMSLLNSYSVLFIVAFIVTLLFTPLVRRAAMSGGIVDHPDHQRKMHARPVPYLGGVAVFVGLLVALALSYTEIGGARPEYARVPYSIILGVIVITFTGLADDIWGWDPRLKIAGQLVAAAALAVEDVGVRVAEGLLKPVVAGVFGDGAPDATLFAIQSLDLAVPNSSLYYWCGTAIIAIFVLGGCNAANLLDGLDGLLTGTIAIVAIGLLAISIIMAVGLEVIGDEPTLSGARVALSFALLGAVLGFLPHNFNPASIFLGDCGSLLLGYVSVAIILMLGDEGYTHIVFAGLIVFAVPVMDTSLAIVRRKISRRPMSVADDQHIHHQLRRALGGVKRAVLALYALSFAFAVLGVSMALVVTFTEIRVRVVYAIAIVLFGSIGVYAFKAARRYEWRMANSPVEAPTKRPARGAIARPPAASLPAAKPRASDVGK